MIGWGCGVLERFVVLVWNEMLLRMCYGCVMGKLVFLMCLGIRSNVRNEWLSWKILEEICVILCLLEKFFWLFDVGCSIGMSGDVEM